MSKFKKNLFWLMSVLFAVIIAIGAVTVSGFAAEGDTSDTTTENKRVTMADLMGRYPVEWVVGPVDVQAGGIDKDTGKYKYIEDEAHKDWNGNYTNNIYGIPADKYFDVESYIYTDTDTKTYVNEKGETVNGRILYGWKPDIQAVVSTNTTKTNVVLAENGAIPDENGKYNNANPTTGIYVTYNWATTTTLAPSGTTERYALIVPSDITTLGDEVGDGKAAFVYGNRAYYAGPKTSSNGWWANYTSYSADHATYGSKYTDFGCFITGIVNSTSPFFWQPRERLAGVYFPEDSRLQEIKGAPDSTREHMVSTATIGYTGANRSTVEDIGKSAFEGCDNLRFMILPGQYDTGITDADGQPIITTGLQAIGANAFYGCKHLVDTNIPSSVTTVGTYAFGDCSEIVSVSVPSGENVSVSSDAFEGCSKLISGGTLYTIAGEPENGVLDTGKSGFYFLNNGGAWSAVGLSGETGEDPDKVFVFPSGADFSNDSDRRSAVQYDTLGCNGEKVKHSLASGSVKNYEIAANFAKDTWCQNIILPQEVKTIGADAFNGSHVSYLETYATTIGARAFADNGTAKGTQYFYLLGGKQATYDVAENAFSSASTRRYIIYENQKMYNDFNDEFDEAVPSWLKKGTYEVRYQIPFVANVYNEDKISEGYDVSLLGGDMAEHFFNDSDYNANPVLKHGNNAITFTKRLSGTAFSYTKQKTGEWSSSGAAGDTVHPILSNMESTVWFSLDSSANKADSAAYETVVSDISGLYSDSTAVINVYTKNICLPTFKTVEGKIDVNAEYTFGSDAVNEEAFLAFDQALLADASYNNNKNKDYVIALAGAGTNGFTYPGDRTSSTEPPEYVQNAGTYRLSASLNAKWGVWKETYKNNERYGVVTVARQVIDLGDIDIYPLFTTSGGTVLSGGTEDGEKTALYFYPEGWFLNKQGGEPDNEASVINSYTRYTGNEVAISHEWEGGKDALFNITYGRGTQVAINSSQNYVYFNLRVKTIGDSQQTNYEFTDASYEANTQAFADRGMRLEGDVTTTSALLRKCWYIVMQSNWFIDANDTLDEKNPLLTPPYKLADKGTEENPWYYEDVVELHMPKLAYGQIDGKPITPSITIYYGSLNSTPLGTVDEANPLSYYINPAMPAGKYFVVLHSDEITVTEGTETATYPAADETIVFDVLSKPLAYEDVVDAIAGGNGLPNFKLDENGLPVYSFKYDGHIHLYGTVADEPLAALNASLNAARAKAKADGDDNYWTDAARDAYYSAAATIAFNLNRWGNTAYYENTYNVLPVNADEYTVYYCISALNYQTYGGADDVDRRDKCFKVVIYYEVSVVNDLLQIQQGIDPVYFQNVIYTGSVAQTRVPYNQYFRYSFDDAKGYIDARKGATVTLTLNNPTLARWNNDLSEDANKDRFKVSDDGITLTVSFDILPAENSWMVTPSMSGWSYKGYEPDVHVVSSRLQFTNTTAKFRLSANAAGGNWITFGSGADAADYFTVDANGKIANLNAVITAGVITDKLNALQPQTYYLFGFADAYGDNGNGLSNVKEIVPDEGLPVVVSKAINRWSTSPDIIRWYWSEYHKTENLISGTPMYFNDENVTGQKVYFTILDENRKAIAGLVRFTAEDGVIVDDESNTLADKIFALPAGTYYLLATVNGTDYYFGLNEFTAAADGTLTPTAAGATLDYTRFVISQFNNYWKTSPSMTGWQYKAYDADSNFVAGVPKFIKGGTEVVYYLIKSDSTSAPTEAEFMANNLWGDDFQTFEVGQYWFLAVAEGTNDFTRLTAPVSFRITTNQTNDWKTIPTISDWVYATGGNHATQGTASFGTAMYTVLKGDAAATVKETVDGVQKEVAIENIDAIARLNALLNLLDAGSYRLNIVSKDGDKTAENANFVAATRTLDFTVEKAINRWATNPTIEGWTWGSAANTPVQGVAQFENDQYGTAEGQFKMTGLYYTASTDGTYSGTGSQAAPTLAGYYAYVTTADESTNYKFGEPFVSFFRIAQFQTKWTTKPEATLSWTYGDVVDTATRLVNAATDLDTLNGVTYTVEYTIEGAASYTAQQIAEKGGITAVLQSLGAGTYSVTAVVHGTEKTYSDVIPATTSVTINKATLSWQTGTAPVNGGWVWDDEVSKKNFVAPVVVAMIRNVETKIDVKYKVSYEPYFANGLPASYDYTDAQDLIRLLSVDTAKSGHAGIYRITVVVENDNYNQFGGEMTVTIERATNAWTENEPKATVEKAYNSFTEEDFPAPKAKNNGTVYYKNSAGDRITPYTWANGQATNQTGYTISVVVDETDNYKPLSKQITIKVLPERSEWSNEGQYGYRNEDGTYTLYVEKSYKSTLGIVVPFKGNNEQVTYSMTYTEFGGTMAGIIDLPSDVDLKSYLGSYFTTQLRNAGTYKLTAVYDPVNPNIETLRETITVVINKIEVSITGTKYQTTETFAYEGANLGVLSAVDTLGEEHKLTYTLTGNGRNETPDIGGTTYPTLNAYLNTLSVGTYTLNVKAAAQEGEAVNYYSEDNFTVSIIITKAPNGWVSEHTPSNASIVRGDADIEHYVEPRAQRGNSHLTITISGGALSQSVQQPAANLKDYLLKQLAAGVYTITYVVPDDDNGNYDGFTAETQFTVSLQGNRWVNRLNTTYSPTWGDASIQAIVAPTASNTKSEPVKFTVTSLTKGVVVPNENCGAQAFIDWLRGASAGTYTIVYSVEANADVAGIPEATSTITINRKANKWNPTPQKSLEWTYGDNEESKLPAFAAEYDEDETGKSLIVYYINGVKITKTLIGAMEGLPVGENYTLRAEIPESTNYRTLYADVAVTVIKGNNSWQGGYEFSMITGTKNETQSYTGWQWSLSVPADVITSAPKPSKSNDVNITVTNKNTNTVVISFVLTYTTSESGAVSSNIETLKGLLRALNAGNYEIKAEIPVSENWSVTGVTAKTLAFEVLANTNAWLNGAPTVQGWEYGGSRNLPVVSGVRFGLVTDVVYTYYYGTEVSESAKVNDFNKAGTYTFTAVLAASPVGNYGELKHTGTFEIEKKNGGMTTAASITGWYWNEFDSAVNLFVGTPASAVEGGKIKFSILDKDDKVLYAEIIPDKNGVISVDLNGLAVGTYKFIATVGETQNYESETSNGTFEVRQALNRWIEYPSISQWAENLWSSARNLPSAKSRFGNITLTVHRVDDDGHIVASEGVYYEATYTKDGALISESVNRLANAKGGKYVLNGKVENVPAKYSGLDDNFNMEVFLSSSMRPTNHWITYPSINDWTAGEAPSEYAYLAYRFTPSATSVTFYYAKKDAKGEIEKDDNGYVVPGDAVPEGELDNNGYPTEPGDYVMSVVAKYTDSDCTDESGFYPYDTLSARVSFKIKKRVIEWTVAPNITDWLLSEEMSVPVAGFNFMNEENSTLTVRYKMVKNSDEKGEALVGKILTELPAVPGDYVMIVTAEADYCDPVEATIDFKVSLAKNTWTDIPVIADWSEENTPNDPLGKAEKGEVTYTYKTLDGVDLGSDKPTAEGTYILCAKVELVGYETLYNEYEFVVSPMYDVTLLAVDISLACVLCALAVVVIVFAIRRYKENG